MTLSLYRQPYLITIYTVIMHGIKIVYQVQKCVLAECKPHVFFQRDCPLPNSIRIERTFPKAYPLSGRLPKRTKVTGRAIRLRSSTVINQINTSIKRTAPRQRFGHRRGQGLPGSRRCQQRGWVSSAHRRWQALSPLWQCHRAWPGIPR